MKPQAVAIVTGASSGIGLATARSLAARGYRLVLNGRGRGALERAASELSAAEPLVLEGDMGVDEDVHRLIDGALAELGRIDVLVNNAGAAWNLPVRAHTPEMIRKTMEVNSIGPALAVLRAWPVFESQGSGCVVNVSSMASLDPFPGFFAYAPSKAAVDMLAKVSAQEGALIGLRAFSVAPGAVETPLLRSAFDEAVLPREQCLRPEDVAELIMDCVEERCDEHNGRVIGIWKEGGRTVRQVR